MKKEGYVVRKDEKNNRKALYVRSFIVSILVLGALLLYWPRFDLVVMAWVFAVLFFINDQLDEQLDEQLVSAELKVIMHT